MSDASRDFDLYDILSVTHSLPIDLKRHLGIQRHITGRPPSAGMWGEQCAGWLFEQHPQLCDVPACPQFDGDEAAMGEWADEQKQRLGVVSLPVEPMPVDRQVEVNAIDEVMGHVDDPLKVFAVDGIELLNGESA